MRTRIVISTFFAASLLYAATGVPGSGDAARGKDLVLQAGCVNCHQVEGQGTKAAADLGCRRGRGYTPAGLAAVLWNHAPMWWAKTRRVSSPGGGAHRNAEDLFTYFGERKYFERQGEARRGKAFFVSKRCAGCHDKDPGLMSGAIPASRWHALGDPVALAHQAWEQSGTMRRACDQHEVVFPAATAQQFTDLMVYLENTPSGRERQPRFSLADEAAGRALFASKGCAECHRGDLAPEKSRQPFTMAAFSAELWNHGLRRMPNRISLSYDDTRALAAYMWAARTPSNAARGKRLFARAGCTSCHDGAAAQGSNAKPVIPAGADPAAALVTGLLEHGPEMCAEAAKRKRAWPRLSADEVADLTAYLSAPAR